MDEKEQAAAYLKLQDDVKQLIIDTIYAELQNYGSPLHQHIRSCTLYSPEFEQKVKLVITNQMQR